MKKMIRKTVAVLVLALFILSVAPMALAKTELDIEGKMNAKGKVAFLEAEGEAEVDGEVSAESESEGKKSINDASKEEFKERRELLKAKIEAEKEFTKEQIEQMRERMKAAKEKYEQARERYEEQKDDLKGLRDRFHGCEEGDDSDECTQVRQKVSVGVKNHLTKTTELIEKSLERLTEHVNDSTVLTAEEKQSALDSINVLETKLTAEKERVMAMAETASAEELRSEVKNLKQLWQDVSKQQKRIIAMMTSSKMENLVDKHADLEESMQKRIDAAKEKGIDTTELEALLARFKTAVAKLEADQASARNFWQQAENMNKESLEQWRDAQEVVKDDLKKTREILREFVKLYAELEMSTAEEAEVNTSKEGATATE